MNYIYGPLPLSTSPEFNEWCPLPTAEGHCGRYLCTDGFAVVNFLMLYAATDDPRYLRFARNLISIVHNILGYTRDHKLRLPSATEAEPLKGGLRIGKNDESGPDGDGQYFHYLTVWMFALNRFTFITGETWHNNQAISMAKAILPKFMTDCNAAPQRMHWKMSMDLSHPLVAAEGNLDPIDGYVTYILLQIMHGIDSEVLKDEIAWLKKIVDTKVADYDSTDTLDLGMVLWTARWFVRKKEWVRTLTMRALSYLKVLIESDHFEESTKQRLAFREFGLILGVNSLLANEGSLEILSSESEPVDTEIRELPNLIYHQWEEAGLLPIPSKHTQGRMAKSPITAVMYPSAIISGLLVGQS